MLKELTYCLDNTEKIRRKLENTLALYVVLTTITAMDNNVFSQGKIYRTIMKNEQYHNAASKFKIKYYTNELIKSTMLLYMECHPMKFRAKLNRIRRRREILARQAAQQSPKIKSSRKTKKHKIKTSCALDD